MPRLTLARMGLRSASNASSVMLNSVKPHRHDAVLAPDEHGERGTRWAGFRGCRRGRAAVAAATSRAGAGRRSSPGPRAAGRPDCTAVGLWSGNSSWSAASISAVELDGFDRGALEPEGLEAVAGLAADRLRLEGAGEGVGVVLQHDDPADGRRVGVDQDEAALERPRGTGEGDHWPMSLG